MYYKDTKIRKIIGNINLFPNFVTLIVETNPLTYMRDLTITAIIKVYQYDELNEADQALVKTAKDATARSYSPYSHFSVGAAVLLGNGHTECTCRICTSNNFAALQGVVNALDMGAADAAGAYKTNSQSFHGIFSFWLLVLLPAGLPRRGEKVICIRCGRNKVMLTSGTRQHCPW